MSEQDSAPEQQNLDLQIADTTPALEPEVKAETPKPVVHDHVEPKAAVAESTESQIKNKKFDQEIDRRLSRVDDLENSLTVLQKQSEAMRERLDKELLNQRVNWAINQGIKGLTRADLEVIIPKVDPSTPEGMATLDAWKQDRPEIFPASDMPKQANAETILATIEDRPNHFWSANKMREIANNSMGKG